LILFQFIFLCQLLFDFLLIALKINYFAYLKAGSFCASFSLSSLSITWRCSKLEVFCECVDARVQKVNKTHQLITQPMRLVLSNNKYLFLLLCAFSPATIPQVCVCFIYYYLIQQSSGFNLSTLKLCDEIDDAFDK
jgi:hypothetical protein